MDLKEKLLSSFVILENEVDLASPIHQIRSRAIKQFEKIGFPSKKEKRWEYTSLGAWLTPDYNIFPKEIKSIDYKEVKDYLLHEIDSYKIVFINGVYSSHLSETSHEGHDICTISAAFQKERYRRVVETYYNKVADPIEHFTVLNTAFAREGAFVHIPKNKTLSRPIQIINFSTASRPIFLQPRNMIILEEGSEAQIIERHCNLGRSLACTNSVTEIFVEARARLDYYKLQDDTKAAALIDNTSIRQKAKSDAQIHTFSLGGSLIRNNLSLIQKGSNIRSTLKGLTVLDGSQHVDHNTLVHHRRPDSESYQEYKGIFSKESVGVFNGRIIVDQEAQKTNAFQQNNNILVSDEASVNAKPQLEIFADDVKCSHGCTIGQLDEDALFYFRSRGIPEKEAAALLMYAFGDKLIGGVSIPELRGRIKVLMAAKLDLNIGFEL